MILVLDFPELATAEAHEEIGTKSGTPWRSFERGREVAKIAKIAKIAKSGTRLIDMASQRETRGGDWG